MTAALLENAFDAYRRGDPAHCAAVLDADRPAWASRPDGWLVRGAAARALGRPAEAESAYRQALGLLPDYPDAWRNLGNLYAATGRHGEAVEAFRRALPGISDAKDRAKLLVLLSASAFSSGAVAEALEAIGAALASGPDLGEVHNQHGKMLWELGHTEASIAAFTQARSADPGNALYSTNHLLVSQFSESQTEAGLAALAREAGSKVASEVPEALRSSFRPPGPSADGRIRIAYISSDFRATAPGFFIHPMLSGHDRRRFEVWALSTAGAPDDWGTQILRYADHWHDVSGTSVAALTTWIRAQNIDVLVDLNGYTGGHRLGVFAARAAPVQVSWLGYEGTTGLPGMDVFLGDPAVVPAEAEACYTERVARLPFDFACYAAPDYAPAVAAAPVLRDGIVTFGSFNKLAKLGPATLALWARVLGAVPRSRLLVKWRHATHPAARDRIVQTLGTHGIAPERLVFRDASPHAAMLAEYGDVDIALDPFPFSGGATTCEALWMGIPVVTRMGQRFASNHTVSHLRAAGFPEWVAGSDDEYVAICQALAADAPRLARLRTSIRSQLLASPLCHAGLYMRAAERIFEDLVRKVSQ